MIKPIMKLRESSNQNTLFRNGRPVIPRRRTESFGRAIFSQVDRSGDSGSETSA